MVELLSRIIEDYKLLREQVCMTEERADEFVQAAREWYDTIVAPSQYLKNCTAEQWAEMERMLQEVFDTINAQVGQCWPTEADLIYDIRRYYALSIKRIKEWGVTHCRRTIPAEVEAPETRSCGIVTVEYIHQVWGTDKKNVWVTGVEHIGNIIYRSTDFDKEPFVGDQYRMECAVCPSPEVEGGDDCFFYWVG